MKILNIVVGCIEYKGKFLLIKRERGEYKQKWALVGGKINFDEEIEEALLREIREETNLTVKFKGIKAVINEKLINTQTKKTLKQFLIILCLTEADSDNIKETDEGELRWFTQNDMEYMKENIIPSDFLMITRLLERQNMNSIIELNLLEKGEELELEYLKEY